MGPSGSGKSTLMHCLAGLDSVTRGEVYVGDTEVTGLNDAGLTRLRREKVGFIFQQFNLLPTLTAEENILLPLAIAGRKPDQDWFKTVDRHRRSRRPARPPARPSSPAASSSASPAPARWSPARRSSSPTSRPATWTRVRAREVLGFLRRSVTRRTARPSSWSPTTPTAASYADRVIFLADGSIVDELDDPTAEARPGHHQAHRSWITDAPRHPEEPARPQAAADPVRARGAARRHVRLRLVRADRHARAARSTTCSPTRCPSTDVIVTAEPAIDVSEMEGESVPGMLTAADLAAVRGDAGVAQAIGDRTGRRRPRHRLGRQGRRHLRPAPLRRQLDGRDRRPASCARARARRADNEIAVNAALAKKAGIKVGDQVGVLTTQPKQTFTLVGIFGYEGKLRQPRPGHRGPVHRAGRAEADARQAGRLHQHLGHRRRRHRRRRGARRHQGQARRKVTSCRPARRPPPRSRAASRRRSTSSTRSCSASPGWRCSSASS